MRQPIRYFSIGLFTASVITLAFSFFTDENEAKSLSLDEMITAIQDDGYRVISESDYISLAVNGSEDEGEKKKEEKKENKEKEKDEAKANEKKDKKKDKQDKEKEEEEVFTYTLHVKPDMVAPTIAELLVENKIIDDAASLSKYLEDEGYSKYIQLGKHKLSSDMSKKEIAEEITKY